MSKCLEWQGHRDKDGYGKWSRRINGKVVCSRAHRVAWESEFGPIPEGKLIRHTCHNPSCINVDHLILGDHSDNMQDMIDAGRSGYGSRNNNAKLTDMAVRVMRRLRASGMPMRHIRAVFGVSSAAAYKATSNDTWKHVSGE